MHVVHDVKTGQKETKIHTCQLKFPQTLKGVRILCFLSRDASSTVERSPFVTAGGTQSLEEINVLHSPTLYPHGRMMVSPITTMNWQDNNIKMTTTSSSASSSDSNASNIKKAPASLFSTFIPLVLSLLAFSFLSRQRERVTLQEALTTPTIVTAATTTTTTSEDGFPSSNHGNHKNEAGQHQVESPTFYFYVGLPKTATSFLQCTLCAHAAQTQPILQRDTMTYIGTCPFSTCGLRQMPNDHHDSTPQNVGFLIHRFPAFFPGLDPLRSEHLGPQLHTNATRASESQQQRLPRLAPALLQSLHAARGRHGLLIYEGAHVFPPEHIQALAQTLPQLGWHDVRILIGYRPLYEWLPSKYNSVYKHKINNLWPN